MGLVAGAREGIGQPPGARSRAAGMCACVCVRVRVCEIFFGRKLLYFLLTLPLCVTACSPAPAAWGGVFFRRESGDCEPTAWQLYDFYSHLVRTSL